MPIQTRSSTGSKARFIHCLCMLGRHKKSCPNYVEQSQNRDSVPPCEKDNGDPATQQAEIATNLSPFSYGSLFSSRNNSPTTPHDSDADEEDSDDFDAEDSELNNQAKKTLPPSNKPTQNATSDSNAQPDSQLQQKNSSVIDPDDLEFPELPEDVDPNDPLLSLFKETWSSQVQTIKEVRAGQAVHDKYIRDLEKDKEVVAKVLTANTKAIKKTHTQFKKFERKCNSWADNLVKTAEEHATLATNTAAEARELAASTAREFRKDRENRDIKMGI